MAAEGTFLAALAEEEARALTAAGRRRRFPRGATIFLEGDASDHVVLVARGRVKVSYLTEEGREVVLAVREPGDLLGELSAIDGDPRSATATALEDVEGVVLDAGRFHAFLASHPRAAVVLLRTVTRRLRDADRKRVEFGALDTVGRVARRLAELAERFGVAGDAGVRIALPFTQEELAAWVGASRKAVTNALRQLRARGWIETGRKSIVICDLEALRKRAI